MSAYYNEFDRYCAQWLRNLIAAGHIAPGDVDERDIRDVRPDDLRGYDQCHFFAGIGVWSYALRLAKWPDTRRVWTGSCPCQPFSVAGRGAGFGDERHLWPYFHALIEECRPPVVLGEQVASKDADPWINLVQADLEGVGYAVGAVPFPSAGVGAPHIRDRLYWVADSGRIRPQRFGESGARGAAAGSAQPRRPAPGRGGAAAGGLEHAGCKRRERGETAPSGYVDDGATPERSQGEYGASVASAHRISEHSADPTNGFWRDADWLFCRDGKWRPVEPGTFPLAHGAPARVGRLRAYGNAINPWQAAAFIETVMECCP